MLAARRTALKSEGRSPRARAIRASAFGFDLRVPPDSPSRRATTTIHAAYFKLNISGMFTASRAAQSAKPRRGDMYVARCAAGFAKLDALMAKVRAALISAAVTGQIAVRSVSTL